MSNETVREVLQERLEETLRESIGDLLKEKYGTQSSEGMITKLIAELIIKLADEAASALGIRESELEEAWDPDEEYEDDKEKGEKNQ